MTLNCILDKPISYFTHQSASPRVAYLLLQQLSELTCIIYTVSSKVKSTIINTVKLYYNTAKGTPNVHYNDVTMSTMASQNTSLTIVYSTAYSRCRWKHFPRNWPFLRGIHRSSVNSPHKGQWRGALMFSLICVWINDRVNNHEADDLSRHRAHYYVIVMQ